MTCLITNVNNLLSLSITSQGCYWTSCDGISVCNHPPLDGNTLGALVCPCSHVFLGLSQPFGGFLAWGEWKDFVDLFLCPAWIAVFADARIVDPLSILK